MPVLTKAKKASSLSLFMFLALSLPGVPAHAETSAEVVPVAQWKPSSEPIVENQEEMTPEDVAEYLHDKHLFDDLSDDSEDARMIFDATKAEGKIIIRVHKSTNPKKPEYLEVLRQKSADPSDLEPVSVFENGASNTALVSTAGTYGKKTYSTPVGSFNIDSMETMHHSSKYNNAPMPYSMFFNGGVAIHGATPNEFAHLGQKASHGCVRVHPTNAKILFDLVRKESKAKTVVQVLGS